MTSMKRKIIFNLSSYLSSSGGGVIVMKASNLEEVKKFISMDPLKQVEIIDYHIVEFKVHDCQPTVKEWFED